MKKKVIFQASTKTTKMRYEYLEKEEHHRRKRVTPLKKKNNTLNKYGM